MLKKLLISMALTFGVATASVAGSYVTAPAPQGPRTDDGRIEVEAVFWYGCPFCYVVEPAIADWESNLPADVEIIHVPAPLTEIWANHARAYYVAEALGVLEQSHDETFRMVKDSHGEALVGAEAIADHYARYGADKGRAQALYSSADITDKLKTDFYRLKGYDLRSVPALIIDGRYIVTGKSAGGMQEMIDAAKDLVNKVRRHDS